MSDSSENAIEFIKLLKSQHRSIVATMSEIDNQPNGPNDLKNSVEKLNKITDILFNHLEREDKELYPTLKGNKNTEDLAKKYFYDMERLSCVSIDFFKRYCANKEGLKIFIEDFVNAYSLFRGLLKVRIQREETELYPAFILLQSGVLYSDVLDYVKEQETKIQNKKKIFICGQNQTNAEALKLGLEILGYEVLSTHTPNEVTSLIKTNQSDLVLLDVTNVNSEIKELIMHLKSQLQRSTPLIGYSTGGNKALEDMNIKNNLDDLISKPVFDIEVLSGKIKEILNK